MTVAIGRPRPNETCTYCKASIFEHDPICVRDCTHECGNPRYFCNHSCLAAHIDEQDLTVGDRCQWRP